MNSKKSQKSSEECTHKKATDQPKEKKEEKKKQSTTKTISKEMRKAEIYCALNTVYHHHSVRGPSKESIVSNNVSRLAIPKSLECRTPKSWHCCYFHVKFMDELLSKGPRLQPRFSSCFVFK